jgi:hypothetical protein
MSGRVRRFTGVCVVVPTGRVIYRLSKPSRRVPAAKTKGAGMGYLAQGIAFASLVAGAVTLEINDKPAAGLWALIVLWAFVANWYPKGDGQE